MRNPWLVIVLAISLSGPSTAGPERTAGGPPEVVDLLTPDSVLRALYESLTFPPGGSPDLARFAGLFASPAAPCIRTTPGAVLATDLQGFLENFGQRLRSGTLKSFREEEASRHVDTYGDIAQVVSLYRKTVNSTDPRDAARGAVDGPERPVGEDLLARATGHFQPMRHVVDGLLVAQRLELGHQANPLAELAQLRAAQLLAELRLPDEQDLNELAVRRLQV